MPCFVCCCFYGMRVRRHDAVRLQFVSKLQHQCYQAGQLTQYSMPDTASKKTKMRPVSCIRPPSPNQTSVTQTKMKWKTKSGATHNVSRMLSPVCAARCISSAMPTRGMPRGHSPLTPKAPSECGPTQIHVAAHYSPLAEQELGPPRLCTWLPPATFYRPRFADDPSHARRCITRLCNAHHS